jgi:hypothetical protein
VREVFDAPLAPRLLDGVEAAYRNLVDRGAQASVEALA